MLALSAPHGGGGHHGGGHGHGHGHHGGGRRGGRGGWPYVIDVGCPAVYAPVLGSDGVVYDNACLADAVGVAVVRGVAGLGCIGCMAPMPLGDTTATPPASIGAITVGVYGLALVLGVVAVFVYKATKR